MRGLGIAVIAAILGAASAASAEECTTSTIHACPEAFVLAGGDQTKVNAISDALRKADAEARSEVKKRVEDDLKEKKMELSLGAAESSARRARDDVKRLEKDLEEAEKVLRAAGKMATDEQRAEVRRLTDALPKAKSRADQASWGWGFNAFLVLLDKVARESGDGEEVSPVPDANEDQEARKAVFQAENCDRELVFCLDRDGGRLTPSEIIPTVRVGEQILVKIFSSDESDTRDSFVITFENVVALERGLGNAPGAELFRAGVAIGDTGYKLMTTVPSTEVRSDTTRVKMRFARGATKADYDLKVLRGTYHLEIELAAAFVPWGARKITPSGRVDTDLDVTPFFGFTWYFSPRTDGKLRYRWGEDGAVGVFVATDFNFTASLGKKSWLAGLMWSPVQGFGLSAGVALVSGQFRASSVDTLDMIDDQVHGTNKLMARPYIALTLTPELIGSLLSASNRARKLFGAGQTTAETTPTEPPKP